MDTDTKAGAHATPWNKGKLLGQKPPLKLKEIWAIRIRLQLDRRSRELALFNLAIDSKLRGCDLVGLRLDRDGPSEAGAIPLSEPDVRIPARLDATVFPDRRVLGGIDRARSDGVRQPCRSSRPLTRIGTNEITLPTSPAPRRGAALSSRSSPAAGRRWPRRCRSRGHACP